jgi:hypothetical protein
MLIFFLTVYLAGVPIYDDQYPHKSLRECKDEGWKILREYQAAGIATEFSCEAAYAGRNDKVPQTPAEMPRRRDLEVEPDDLQPRS